MTDPLPNPWYLLKIADGADCNKPGVYEWVIDGVGSYIGKYKSFSRPSKEYSRNIRNLLTGKAYRKGKPTLFRRIHHELADAVRAGKSITLIILENPPLEDINRREQELIAIRGNLNGSRLDAHKTKS